MPSRLLGHSVNCGFHYDWLWALKSLRFHLVHGTASKGVVCTPTTQQCTLHTGPVCCKMQIWQVQFFSLEIFKSCILVGIGELIQMVRRGIQYRDCIKVWAGRRETNKEWANHSGSHHHLEFEWSIWGSGFNADILNGVILLRGKNWLGGCEKKFLFMYRAHVCVEHTNTHMQYINTSHWGVIRKTKCLKKFCGKMIMERRLRNAVVAEGLWHLTRSMTSLIACPLIW